MVVWYSHDSKAFTRGGDLPFNRTWSPSHASVRGISGTPRKFENDKSFPPALSQGNDSFLGALNADPS
jgi:hypothetical protein